MIGVRGVARGDGDEFSGLAASSKYHCSSHLQLLELPQLQFPGVPLHGQSSCWRRRRNAGCDVAIVRAGRGTVVHDYGNVAQAVPSAAFSTMVAMLFASVVPLVELTRTQFSTAYCEPDATAWSSL